MDSITNLKVKTTKGEGLGRAPWLAALEGRRVYWSFGMGTRKIDN